ncbi:hypothetical protein Scep_027518 [Stephania cephalantha]|uniref:Uncharacterized protein n=1 Tax=Stephania cephalantha TaxID=152367 RepID=A0AAP0E8A3_9MAGN
MPMLQRGQSINEDTTVGDEEALAHHDAVDPVMFAFFRLCCHFFFLFVWI